MVLGAGGKMGPTLARMARRAAPGKRILAVARFSNPALAAALEAHGVEPIRADLLERAAIARLPRVPNVILMAGHKFGSSDAPSRTWATNTILPDVRRRGDGGEPDRGVLDGQRLPVRPGRLGRRDGGRAAAACSRRLHGELHRPRAGAALVLRDARHAGRDLPAQLRDRPALRRLARRRAQGARRRARGRDHGPRQRDLAGRRERARAALPAALHGSDGTAQRDRARDGVDPRARPRLRRALRQLGDDRRRRRRRPPC